ncbi:ATP-binding protein [Tumebacillus sp. DT12]|uniref:histidine kinase n=1 Tax=Tumebacillus lacus TaxID=2995335 RepID=A0ABT3X6E8_9BACL|nr:ATP-binding protein [Tumebacillus lacus]
MDLLLPGLHWGFAGVWLGVALFTWKRFGRLRTAGLQVWVLPLVLILSALVVTSFYAALYYTAKAGYMSGSWIDLSLSERQVETWQNIICVIGVLALLLVTERTERLQQAAVVSGLHARYRYVIEADPRAILLFDGTHWKLAEINRQARELLAAEEIDLIGQMAPEVLGRLYPDSPETASDLIRRMQVRDAIEIKQGERILGEFEWTELRDERGRMLGYMCSFRDITEEKKFQREIIQSEKLAVVGQLAAATAHEIRNPLTSIKGFLQLINQRLQGNDREDEITQYTTIMVEEVDRMEKIIRDFLLMTKPSDVMREEACLNGVIERVLVLIENQAILRNIEVSTDLTPLSSVHMHKEAIQQVVLNLMQNALEAMNIGGTLSIRTGEEPEYVWVCVHDTGCGMTEEEVANLGSPFYSTKTEGTGLGLTVSMKIIREHRGRFDVVSEKGVGTTITVRLPKQ